MGNSADDISYKIKTDSTEDFCPEYLTIYTEEHEFKNLNKMSDWYKRESTNERRHMVTRRLPKYQKIDGK